MEGEDELDHESMNRCHLKGAQSKPLWAKSGKVLGSTPNLTCPLVALGITPPTLILPHPSESAGVNTSLVLILQENNFQKMPHSKLPQL